MGSLEPRLASENAESVFSEAEDEPELCLSFFKPSLQKEYF